MLTSKLDLSIWLSSANTLHLVSPMQFGRSFMYSRNNKGPSIDPCGIPPSTFDG